MIARRPRYTFLMPRIGFLIGCILLALGATATARADQSDPELPALFAQLKNSETREQALRTEQRIWAVWKRHSDPRVESFMRIGLRYMGARQLPMARKSFTRVIEIDPDYAEGWNKRATVNFLMDRYEESVADIFRTLEREPRHFGALSGLGQIYRRLDAPESALMAFERVMEIHPYAVRTEQSINELRAEIRRRQL